MLLSQSCCNHMDSFSKARTCSWCFDRKGEEVTRIVLLLICPLSTYSRESIMVRTEAQRFVYQIITSEMLKIQRKEKGKRLFVTNLI